MIVAVLHRVLNFPPVVVAKRPLKDLLWTVRGRGIRNPAGRRRVRSILFVCKGNICRSPFASVRMRQLLDAAGISGIACASAGIRTTQAAAPPAEAREAAARYGLELGTHEPLQLSAALVEAHDLIVVMEAGQLAHIRRTYPEAADRIVLLSLIDQDSRGYHRFHIADPFGHPVAMFEACYSRIDRLLRQLLEDLRQ